MTDTELFAKIDGAVAEWDAVKAALSHERRYCPRCDENSIPNRDYGCTKCGFLEF